MKQVSPKIGGIYAILIDIAGEEESQTDGQGQGKGQGHGIGHGQAVPLQENETNARRDATALTVVEVDLGSLQDELIKAPTYRVVFRKLWVGVQHTKLYGEILALAKMWGVKKLVVDATGVGAGLASFLDRALPGVVIQFKFNSATKSQLGWDFLSVVDTGRFKDYVPADSDQVLFIEQLEACQYAITPGVDRRMKWGVPDGMRNSSGEYVHDDLIISAALCSVLDKEQWSVGGEMLVVKGMDPLHEMDKEGF